MPHRHQTIRARQHLSTWSRQIFAAFHLAEVTTRYTIGAKNDPEARRAELLISNFKRVEKEP